MKTTEQPEATAGETLPTPSANERWKAGIKSKNPDKEFASDDDYYEASMGGYDAEHEKVKAMLSSNKELADRMMQDPKAAAALAEFMEGKPLPAAIKKYFTDDELAIGEGEEGYEEYITAVKERTEREANNKAMQEEYDRNLAASEATTEAFAQENGMSPEEFSTFVEKAVSTIIEPLLKGNITKELLDVLFKGLNYEQELAVREDVAYKKGKNEKIKTGLKSFQADGLPSATAGGGTPENAQKVTDPTAAAFDKVLANNAENDIFKRGGYQRVGK